MLKHTLLVFTILLLTSILSVDAQMPTLKDSAMNKDVSSTVFGSYGDASYQRNFNTETSTLNLNRFVLFMGHQFNSKIAVFSELEVEDAKIEGGESGGEVSLEQAYIQFQFNKKQFLIAGLFTPRIGILNEDHLPTQFNGVERNMVERLLIPVTWRELGVSYYGRSQQYPIVYSLALTNGLNSAGFEHGSGIRGGRFEGRNASANNFALTGALQYNPGYFRLQVSGYYGGSVGLNKHQADSLQLYSGMFGTPVVIGEAHAIYEKKGFQCRILGTFVTIPDADRINTAYANNTPETEVGAYAEVGYNLFQNLKKAKKQKLIAFARYEYLDLNASLPDNGIDDQTLNQQHIIAGFTYLPINNVVIKVDVRLLNTGDQNPALVINPSPTTPPYENNNSFLNIGIGYSF